jgi:serralysin
MGQTINFSEQPDGTTNPVYRTKIMNVAFGTTVKISSGALVGPQNSSGETIGPIGTNFVSIIPGAPVTHVTVAVGGDLDDLGTTSALFYNTSGGLFGTQTNNVTGVWNGVSDFPSGIGAVLVENSKDDPIDHAPEEIQVNSVYFENTPPLVAATTVAPVGGSSSDINGELWGYKWPTSNFTYSFPTSTDEYLKNGYHGINGFAAMSATQQAVVKQILADYSSFCNVTFTQSSSPDALFRFANAQQIDQADGLGLHIVGGAGGTATSSTPDPHHSTTSWGDAWFYNGAGGNAPVNANPVLGNFGYTAAFMHETGHNLGLKHGHSEQDDPGGSPGDLFPQLPADHDSQEYSIMTYNTYPGVQGSTNDYPETPMLDDIAALQYIYGANYSNAGTNQVYKWDPTNGQEFINGVGQGVPANNHILVTVWDGGGNGVYDLSNYNTNVVADLHAGGWINLGTQLADLDFYNHPGVHMARGNIATAYEYQGNPTTLFRTINVGNGHNYIIGNDLGDAINVGSGGHDLIYGGKGADVINGSGDASTIFGLDGNNVVIWNGSSNTIIVGDDKSGQNALIGGNNNAIIGGFGADTLKVTGNFNTLVGYGGGDLIQAIGVHNHAVGGQNSTNLILFGGNQNTLEGGGGAGGSVILGGGDANSLVGGAGANTLRVTGNGNVLVGQSGNDTFAAVGSSNALFGQAGNDNMSASGNFNTLNGGTGTDWIGVSGNYNKIIGAGYLAASGAGNAVIGGGTLVSTGSNILAGDGWLGASGDGNWLLGQHGSDFIGATGNHNTLDPGTGNSHLVAAPGHQDDHFYFHPGYQHDEITGFTPHSAGGSDIIDLTGFGISAAGVLGFFGDQGANTVMVISAGTTLVVDNIHKAQLSTADFKLS